MRSGILKKLPPSVKGGIVWCVLILNTLFFSISMCPVIFVKILIPWKSCKRQCTAILEWVTQGWIGVNLYVFAHLHETQWEIASIQNLSNKNWYFLICNHQSFADIFVLQKVFSGKIPSFKFFMKQSLIWMPVVGIVWWALDCIFMKRYSKETLDRNPHLREVDMQATQKKCREFKHRPVTIVNFVEGTRFTKQKQAAQPSNYQYLLNPKAGGLAYMVAAMEGRVHDLIDVTIAYPDGPYNFWDFLCGRIKRIKVQVDVHPIPSTILKGDYFNNPHYRAVFKQWLISLWDDKDQLLGKMLKNGNK